MSKALPLPAGAVATGWWRVALHTLSSAAQAHAWGLFILWMMDAAHNDLRMGWFFSWQIVWIVGLVPPDVRCDRKWLRVRRLVHFLSALASLCVDVAFIVLRVIDFISKCDTGSSCEVLMTQYVVATAIAAIMGLSSVALLYVMTKCPGLSDGRPLASPELLL
jgi:hypothetical protein